MGLFTFVEKSLNTKKLTLIAILVLALFLRLWHLNTIPPSASLDEASIGYNAYSVLKTGVDEFGKFPLISQRGYDDYRRSTYLLLVIPFVAILNLTVVAVRLPAVILSVLTIWATYEIALLLFHDRSKFGMVFAYVSALLLAISPWHIYISRLGHESNACLSFLVFGVLFFLKGLNKKYLLLFAAFFLTLSMISYYSGQVFIPLLVIGLFVIYYKQLFVIIKSDIKTIVISIGLILMLIPIVWAIFSPEALIRFRGTSTFSPDAHGNLFRERVLLRNEATKNHNIIKAFVYNQHFYPFLVAFDGYRSHFSPQWLFFNFSSDSFKAPHNGLLYLWEFPFIAIGFFGIIFSLKLDSKSKKLIMLWFILGPLPASIATQAPHAMRSYNFLPTWQYFSAFGITYLLYRFYKYRKVTIGVYATLVIVGFCIFYRNYFVLFPKEQSKSFQYAYAKTVPYILENQNKFNKIVISNDNNMYQSYMLFLYFSRYNPSEYQRQGGTKSGGYAQTHAFGKYEFRPINWKNEKSNNSLYIANPQEIPSEETTVFTGRYLNGTIGAKVVISKIP